MISSEFLITSLIVVLIPGTGVIYTISTGLFMDSKSSLFAAIGCTAGIIPHLLASVFGLAAVLHMSSVVFQVIKILGVIYLLYLAWSMWNQNGSIKFNNNNVSTSAWRVSVKGFLINILNPKLSLFFLAFLPQFIPVQTATPVFNLLALGLIFMLMTLVVFIGYGLLANKVSQYILTSTSALKNVQRMFASIFAILAVKLALAER